MCGLLQASGRCNRNSGYTWSPILVAPGAGGLSVEVAGLVAEGAGLGGQGEEERALVCWEAGGGAT